MIKTVCISPTFPQSMGTARLVITEKYYPDLLYSKILFGKFNGKNESRMRPAEQEKFHNGTWFKMQDWFQKECVSI